MPRPFSLQTVLELMQARSDEATQRLATLLAVEVDVKRKLTLLQDYRDEYAARFREAARHGLGQPEWRNYQSFLGRLDEAVRQQLEAVSRQAAHTAAGQAEWQQQRARLKAFDALSRRHRAGEAREELRQEQKTQDEFAARVRDDGQSS
jgi:flagellar FliJ protein